MRDPIPLGPFTVSVTRSDALNVEDLGLLTVHFRLQCPANPPDPVQFVKSDRFSLQDSQGKKYKGFPSPEPRPGANPAAVLQGLRKHDRSSEQMTTPLGVDLDRWTAI